MMNGGPGQIPHRVPSSQTTSPNSQSNNPFDSDSSFAIGSDRSFNLDGMTTLLIRKLPTQTTPESLRAMLLFTKDFIGAEFVSQESPQDQGFLTAIARFRNYPAAEEAQARLHGKQNQPNESPLYVELTHRSPGGGLGSRRDRPDMAFNRASSNSNSSTGSSTQGQQYSRFNGAYQAIDRISPPNIMSTYTNGAPFSPGENGNPISPRSFYSPQSPMGQALGDRQRVSGKAVIREDGVDDEPGDLLKDPVAFAKNDASEQLSRHPTHPQLLSRLSNLSLSTSHETLPMSGFVTPRSTAPLQSPTGTVPLSNLGPNGSFQMASQFQQRQHHFPPVNPADQNPPCNTLYVGNLPMDTSEDELKNMFSKQRGYKRLCFRTKQNGPMCFVEFEDITFATKALHELYGHMLHNSVKGGIRLSFSKNPLGVRTGQPGGMGPPTPLSPSGPMPNWLSGAAPFSTANGPPPGLAAPPGLNTPMASMNGMITPPSNVGSFNLDGVNGVNGAGNVGSSRNGGIPDNWARFGIQVNQGGQGRPNGNYPYWR